MASGSVILLGILLVELLRIPVHRPHIYATVGAALVIIIYGEVLTAGLNYFVDRDTMYLVGLIMLLRAVKGILVKLKDEGSDGNTTSYGLVRETSNFKKVVKKFLEAVFFSLAVLLCFMFLFLLVEENAFTLFNVLGYLAALVGIVLVEKLTAVLDLLSTSYLPTLILLVVVSLFLFIGVLFRVVADQASIFQIIAGMALCFAILAVAWKLFIVFKWSNKLKLFFYAMKLPRPLLHSQSTTLSVQRLQLPDDDDIDEKEIMRSVSKGQLQQSMNLDEKELDKRADRFRNKVYENLRQERVKARSDEGGESVRAQIEQFPSFKRQFISGYGLELTEALDAEEWHDAEALRLMDKGLSNLPEEPMCPKLIQLLLQRNYKLRKISTSFFINMPLLEVLDLSETGIMSLPKSLFELACLNKLFLRNCEQLMMLPPEVGKLKRLQVLDMEGTEIINLPLEIKELSFLRRLRFSLYGGLDHDWKSRQSNAMIPFAVISALSQLEEICIHVNPADERWNACVEGIMNEICGLTSLHILELYFPRVEHLRNLKWNQMAMISPSLSDFIFIVGRHSKRIISRLPRNVEFELERLRWRNRCLKYINGEGVPEDIKKVLQHATAFHLDRHMTVKKLTEFGIENMQQLKFCVLGECNEIKAIIDGNDVKEEDDNGQTSCESSGVRKMGLESLEFLSIYYMKNLKSIWNGPVHKKCFILLESLTLSTCPQLTTIFTMGLLENLHNLEELTVRDCPSIQSLVICEKGVNQSGNYLPKLRTILLHYVPDLVSIFSEVSIAPKLEVLSLYNCPKLKSLSKKEVASEHLREIIGEKEWWEALEWTQIRRNQFDGIFVPINEDTCL